MLATPDSRHLPLHLLLLLVGPNGNLCNPLFQSVLFHVYCLEHQLLFFNLGILGMLRGVTVAFEVLRDSVLIPPEILARMPVLGGCIRRHPPEQLLSPVVCVGGWGYRCIDFAKQYRDWLSAVICNG